MKKSTLIKLKYIIYALFVVSTISTFVIVYKDIDSAFSFKFVIAYVIFLFIFSGYLTIATIINLRTLKLFEIRKRLFKFIGLFVIFSALNYIINYCFKGSKADFFDGLGSNLGMSFGLSFFDIAFFNRKKD